MGSIDISFVFGLEKTKKETIVPKQSQVKATPITQAKDSQPAKLDGKRKLLLPPRPDRASIYDSEDSVAESLGRTSRSAACDDLYSSNEENPFSNAASSKSSVVQDAVENPGTGQPQVSHDAFKPKRPPGGPLITPTLPKVGPQTPSGVAGHLSDPDENGTGSRSGQPEASVAVPQERNTQPNAQADSIPMAKLAIKDASKVKSQTDSLQKRGRRKMTVTKFIVAAGLIALNGMFIFASWWWQKYYYIYLPFICLPLALNCFMIASIIFFKLRNTARPEKIIEPEHVESFGMVIPCYNETREEMTKSLDSLVVQTGIDDNKKAIIVICDGRVRGPGMEKSTADYLFEDILTEQTHRSKIKKAYMAWDGQQMDIEVAKGFYKGLPFCCIVKDQNQGKRDSLIVVRSFLHKFNHRRANPEHIFSPRFFDYMESWLGKDVDVDYIDHLVGMDADTVFDTDCISQLLKESKYPHTVGVCGYVAVDFSGGSWNLWSLYQNSEYSIAQGLRRLHQSIATKKVSCLPGCCQLLRICEYTCGDKVLVELFGYHPKPLDGLLKQIRATASEDRNHVCLMLTTHPEAQTRQALRARAFTDVPHSWSVYLSQRRRWTLGATSNDLLLSLSWHCQWWERILAFSNVLGWCLNVFIIASIACMVVAFMSQPWWIILAFASVMIVPLCYYLVMTLWLPRSLKEKMQYLAGLFIFVVFGPFVNITVLLFAVWNMDSFGWGKTRMVVADDNKDESTEKRGTTPHITEPDSSMSGQGHALMEKPRQPDEEAAVETMIHRPTSTHVRSPLGVEFELRG
ncbi:unnamed protein product [Clonostachys byssicola]|uniref:chitin synthase n=1 Tax=Clonostachys byssicola TaxID=160290 RepID=A0A9N9UNS3_9HYPO|nr:unnamed protein product [Clonostachys byssicola]